MSHRFGALGAQTAGLVNNCCEQHSVPSTLCQRDISTKFCQTIAQGTLATTSAAEAVKKAAEDKKSSTTDRSTLIAKPNIFDYQSQEEEIKAFGEWSLRVIKALVKKGAYSSIQS